MDESSNTTVNLFKVNEGTVKESLERLLIVRQELTETEQKIKFQDEEMEKTQKMIAQYQEYYDNQNKALEHFKGEKDKLTAECNALIAVLNKPRKDETSKKKKRKSNDNPNSERNLTSKRSRVEDHLDTRGLAISVKEENQISTSASNGNEPIANGISVKLSNKQLRQKRRRERAKSRKSLLVSKENAIAVAKVLLDGGNSRSINDDTEKRKTSTDLKSSDKLNSHKVKAEKNSTENFDSVEKSERPEDLSTTLTQKSTSKVSKHPVKEASVTLKIAAEPPQMLLSVGARHKIHRILQGAQGVTWVCGSQGLLAAVRGLDNKVMYRGHDDYYVYDMYLHQDTVVSLGFDYILRHSITDPATPQRLCSFPKRITCSYLHGRKLYLALESGLLFVVDLGHPCPSEIPLAPFAPLPHGPQSMVVTEAIGGFHLVMVLPGKEGILLRLPLFGPPVITIIAEVPGGICAVLAHGRALACYSDTRLFLVDKKTWGLIEVRETSNKIVFAQMVAGRVILVDGCNILHKYVLRGGHVTAGSSVESLSLAGRVTAVHVCEAARRVYLGSMAEVYHQKL